MSMDGNGAPVRPQSCRECRASVEDRVADLLARMTLEEKIGLMSGIPKVGFTGYIPACDRLGIPALTMSDGPVGVKSSPRGTPPATLFPAPIALAATWDLGLVERVGTTLGLECRANGVHVLLAPCVNIVRVPLGGRSFESFGEDPHLAAEMAVAYIRGVQGQKVAACVKHYAANNQEWQRHGGDSVVDERTLGEIYLPAFRAAVQRAGVLSVMGSYNRLNGAFACENEYLLSTVLKQEWGFTGFVVSDWGGTHSSGRAAKAGLDVEMPGGVFFTEKLLNAVRAGEVSEDVIDEAVRRVLRVMFEIGLFDGAPEVPGPASNPIGHRDIALRAAREAIVLLKNDRGVLPLDRSKVRSLAVIGPYAVVAKALGGGSSFMPGARAVSPLEAMAARAGDAITIHYAQGCPPVDDPWPAVDASFLRPPAGAAGAQTGACAGAGQGPAFGLLAEHFPNVALDGEPALRRIDAVINPGGPLMLRRGQGFSIRWTGTLTPPVTGSYEFALSSDDGMRFYLDGQLVIDSWRDHGAALVVRRVELEGGRPYDLRLEYYCRGVSAETGGQPVARLGWRVPGDAATQAALDRAARIARDADVAVVFVADEETEGRDRTSLDLPGRQDELIEAVAAANENTVVVVSSGAPVLMGRWVRKVAAVVEAWYPGQEAGAAIADVLFGIVNPSGKLPVTFPARWEDCPVAGSAAQYPGEGGVVRYSEGVFVGYRHFDARGLEPLFPFGHGLSYTSFEYGDLEIAPRELSVQDLIEHPGRTPATISVRVTVRNSGAREGVEVVQLYVGDEQSGAPRPPRELKGFARLALAPGRSAVAAFEIGHDALAFYDPARKAWVVEPGRFEVAVGSSSRDIRVRGSLVVTP